MSNKGLLKNIASLGAVQIANYVFPLISIPIISRIIGPDKFGVINYAIAFISYFTLLISYGFDLTATRRVVKDPQNVILRSRIFSEVFYAKILLFSLSVILFSICLFIVPPLMAEKSVAIYTFLFCIGTVFTQNWLFQGMNELPKVAILNLISKFLFTFAILLIVQKKADYVWQPLLSAIIQISIALASFYWAKIRYHLTFVKVSLKDIIDLLLNERTVFFSLVAVSLYTTTNTVVLGLMTNETQVGYYTAGQRLIDVASTVINIPLSQALYPFIGMAFAESKEIGILTVQKIIPLIVFFTVIMAFGMLIFGPIVLKWFYGNSFSPSVPVFQIIAFVPFVIALSNVFGIQIMLNLNMDKIFFKITAGGAIIGIILNIIMVHYLGSIGTALNWLVVELYITMTMYLVLKARNVNPIDLKQFNPKLIINQLKGILIIFGKK